MRHWRGILSSLDLHCWAPHHDINIVFILISSFAKHSIVSLLKCADVSLLFQKTQTPPPPLSLLLSSPNFLLFTLLTLPQWSRHFILRFWKHFSYFFCSSFLLLAACNFPLRWNLPCRSTVPCGTVMPACFWRRGGGGGGGRELFLGAIFVFLGCGLLAW